MHNPIVGQQAENPALREWLLLEGLSLHKDGISRIISRDKIQLRWVEISLITLRLAGFAAPF